MSSTDQILKAAEELGNLISKHDAAMKFEASVKKLQNDTEAQRVLNDLNRHVASIHEKESKNEPIEVAEKRQLEELQRALINNQRLRDFQLIQMNYLDLMRKVDEAMQGPAAPAAASNLSHSTMRPQGSS